MDIVKTFGGIIGNRVEDHPDTARKLLLAGYAAQRVMLAAHPDKRLPPSRRFIACTVMDQVRFSLKHAESSAAVSLFTPCEPLQAAGIMPYSVETLSAFLAGTQCEQEFLRIAGESGFPETLCSYHRTFLGALESGLVPKPSFIVYTNLACDGNMITFPHLQRTFEVPAFFVDVPYERSEDSVQDVARQLEGMVEFVADITGKPVEHADLEERVATGARTAAAYNRFIDAQRTHRLPSDMTSEMYAVLVNRILLGTPEAERFATMLADEAGKAPSSDGIRLVWMHLIPNMLSPVVERLSFTDRAFVTACDLAADAVMGDFDPARPYETMARRLVYSAFNGNLDLRISRALELADRTGADGVVLFAHWGCKATLGAAGIITHAMEEAGLPCLVLDGDGCDRVNTSEGQTATRLDAFLEMIEATQDRKQDGETPGAKPSPVREEAIA
jgi:benzoyl-CoA reductase/2-hydroxyglutaryl-CoA dehydratase subunit BcrC/BadD/HgdB